MELMLKSRMQAQAYYCKLPRFQQRATKPQIRRGYAFARPFMKNNQLRTKTMTPSWPSMRAFLSQQQQEGPSSPSNTNQHRSASNDNNNNLAPAQALFKASTQPGLSTQQRIDLEKAGCQSMLSKSFSAEEGYRIVGDCEMPQVLVTRSGRTVPESHTSLTRILVRDGGLKAVHLYAHEYEDLRIEDLAMALPSAMEALGASEGQICFGIVNLGSRVSFFQMGGPVLERE